MEGEGKVGERMMEGVTRGVRLMEGFTRGGRLLEGGGIRRDTEGDGDGDGEDGGGSLQHRLPCPHHEPGGPDSGKHLLLRFPPAKWFSGCIIK